jgi:hypothetical protein
MADVKGKSEMKNENYCNLRRKSDIYNPPSMSG